MNSTEMKPGRIVWGKGDFGAMARLIWGVGDRIVERVDVKEGEDVIDVACGTGNAALRAAARGARVTGLDIVPDLLEQGRGLAAEEGVEVNWIEGDAQELPFEDGSFDVVLSTFGCMFAPDHRATAAGIARVLRPGGRIGICSWTPTGKTGEFFKIIASHLPAPPEGFQPPALWGVEEHVSEIFAGTGVEPEFAHEHVDFLFESPEDALATFETKFGPVVNAKEMLEPQGKWDAMAADMLGYFTEQMRDTGDGSKSYAAEYLAVTGSKRSA
jgi:SAM-dependent methyltransferase